MYTAEERAELWSVRRDAEKAKAKAEKFEKDKQALRERGVSLDALVGITPKRAAAILDRLKAEKITFGLRREGDTRRKSAVRQGSISPKQMAAHRAKHGKACAACGIKATTYRQMTIDHINPIRRGGLHELRNIQFLCSTCNSSKGALDPVIFAQINGRLC